MFLNEKADVFLLPYLEKSDMVKLSMSKYSYLFSNLIPLSIFCAASQMFNSVVSSRHLFSTILVSINDVVKQYNLDTPKKKAKVFTSSASKNFIRNHQSKFGKRFNMGGSGFTTQQSKTASKNDRIQTPSTNSTLTSSMQENQN